MMVKSEKKLLRGAFCTGVLGKGILDKDAVSIIAILAVIRHKEHTISNKGPGMETY